MSRTVGYSIMKLANMFERGMKNQAVLDQCPEAKPHLILSGKQMLASWEKPIAPLIVGVSPELYTVQDDWSEDMRQELNFTGFWCLEKQQQKDTKEGKQSMEALDEFLAKGTAPVYLGWGSMIADSPEFMACLAVRSLMKAEMRGIIVGGWAKLDPSHLKGQPDTEAMEAFVAENVLFLPGAPHEVIFPQCAVTVHHGGIGTMAAGLRSGRPQIITPIATDQWTNADTIARIGCGVAMPHLSKVSVEQLAKAIQTCVQDENVASKSREMGERVLKEDGNAKAVDIIDRFIADELETGKWKVKFEQQTNDYRNMQSSRCVIS